MLFKFIVLTIVFIGECLSMLPYCQPSNTTCWPTQQEINEFAATLNGTLIVKNMNDANYNHYVNMQQNALYKTYPSYILLCKSHGDVQKSVKFSASHNLQISVISTGHDYAGRNSANNSLQINLSLLQSYKLDTDKLRITVETGLEWWPIYHIINESLPFDAVIVGCSEGTVGPAGYTLGAGHSPIGPQYGLASDFTLEYYMVNANADIIHVYNTTNNSDMITQLFWSLKGGGACTFGVILNITFELHALSKNNSKYTLLNCEYPLTTTSKHFIGSLVINGLFNWINTDMDPMWGGYFLGSAQQPVPHLTFSFNYYGDPSYAKQNSKPITTLNPYNPNGTGYCQYLQYNTFYDYSITIPIDPGDQGTYLNYIWNDLVPKKNLTQQFTEALIGFLNDSTQIGVYSGWTANMVIGGNVHNYPYGYTAVSKGFRSSQFVFDPWVVVNSASNKDKGVAHGQKWEENLRKFGSGIYFNEENPSCPGCDWKAEFWGQQNYNKLLNVKQYYDPNQVFWCVHCVGSDLQN